MELQVRGNATYCYGGGRPFDGARPSVVFIHGVLNDHSVWGLQARWFAHHGFNVLAVDLPGHCRSAGEPLPSVEDGAAFVTALLDAAGVARAALVGHSFGSLVALETAAAYPLRVSHLALVATAAPMAVAPALLQMSRDRPAEAIDLVNVLSHSQMAHAPSSLGPGTWVHGASRALMRRVLASNASVNLLWAGFAACDTYAVAEQRMSAVECPVLFVLGARDQMTPPRAAAGLVRAAGQRARVRELDAGHALMAEAPDGVLFALRDFIRD